MRNIAIVRNMTNVIVSAAHIASIIKYTPELLRHTTPCNLTIFKRKSLAYRQKYYKKYTNIK